jgi:hypothetical protein
LAVCVNRKEFARGGSANRYQMRQQMVAIGDDFWIAHEHG